MSDERATFDAEAFADEMSDRQDAGLLTASEYWTTFGDDEPDVPFMCQLDPATIARYAAIPDDPWWRHLVRFHDWHLWKVNPARLINLWERMRRGWSRSDAWSLDRHLARQMAQSGRYYIDRQHFVTHGRPGFALWVEGMEHYVAGCHCRKSRAAVRALPRIFGSLWL